MRSEVWRPASRLVTAPREVRGPARQALRPGCEELAARAAEEMLQTEARPPAVNRQGRSAERRAFLQRKERVALASATKQDMRLSALRHPSAISAKDAANEINPGANASRERGGVLECAKQIASMRRRSSGLPWNSSALLMMPPRSGGNAATKPACEPKPAAAMSTHAARATFPKAGHGCGACCPRCSRTRGHATRCAAPTGR